MILDKYPPRLYTSDVLEILGISDTQWRDMRKQGIAPKPIWRGRNGQYVYRTMDISRLLGEDPRKIEDDNDVIMQGLEKLGHA